MQRHHICRFCGEYEFDADRLVKYGVRHYAHHSCYLDRKSLDELELWQVRRFPFKLLRERGLLAHVAELIRNRGQ